MPGNSDFATPLTLRVGLWCVSAEGLFIFVGHYPNTDLFKGKLEMDDEGYVISDRFMHTSVDGVFVAGEAQDHYFRQAITSAGEGCQAAMEAEKFLAGLSTEGSS